ncbi:hypothetical protein [Catenibacterium mitsuokai]|uniref:hypothetical protein n=1 Tax=Catenibacterium mitsuokai TaxID=100886 RepID=UPI003F90037E
MVTFCLKEETAKYIIYLYYPEGDESQKPGVIVVDKEKEEIDITEVSENDIERDIQPEELNELAIAINEMKKESGDTDYVELATEPEHSIYYGDHAVREICKYLVKGEVPKKGMQAWY